MVAEGVMRSSVRSSARFSKFGVNNDKDDRKPRGTVKFDQTRSSVHERKKGSKEEAPSAFIVTKSKSESDEVKGDASRPGSISKPLSLAVFRENSRRLSIKESKEKRRCAPPHFQVWRENAAASVGRPDQTTLQQLTNLLSSVGEDGERSLVPDVLKLPIFMKCSHGLITDIANKMESKAVAVGEFVAQQGDQIDSLYMVSSGSLDMYSGEEFLGILEQGDSIGELAMLGLEHRSPVTLKCNEVGTVIGIVRKVQFRSIIENHPEKEDEFTKVVTGTHLSLGVDFIRDSAPMFEGLSSPVVEALESCIVHRFFFPGEFITEQGQLGQDLYILSYGQVNVVVDGEVTRTLARDRNMDRTSPIPNASKDGAAAHSAPDNAAVCIGELGFLGIEETRAATVISKTACHIAVVHRPVFLKLLEEKDDSLEIEHLMQFLQGRYKDTLLSSRSPTKNLQDIHIFKEVDCSNNFMEYLASHLQERLFLPGQSVVQEGLEDKDRSMYIVSAGKLQVWKAMSESTEPAHVATLHQGDVFGESMLLGIVSSRASTVVAEETAYLKVITQNTIIKALRLFPNDKTKVLMLGYKTNRKHASDEVSPADGLRAAFDEYKAICKKVALAGVQKSKLFGGVNGLDYFVEELSRVSQDRIYLPGEYIIEEGQAGDSMFVMVSGKACAHVTQVENRDQKETRHKLFIGVLETGSISGELCLLGVAQKRSANIEAESMCCMWEVGSDQAMPIIQGNHEVSEALLKTIVHHLEHTVPNIIDSLPLFQAFDRKFRMLIGLYGERKACFSGTPVFKEGAMCDSMYVLNLGRAILECKGTSINSYVPGSYFNVACMLNFAKRTMCTLTAFQTCHVVLISHTSYQHALEQYPCREGSIELKQREQIAHDAFKKDVHRLCSKKVMWKQAATAMAIDVNFGGVHSGGQMNTPKTLNNKRQTESKGMAIDRSMVPLMKSVVLKWQTWATKTKLGREKAIHDRRVFDNWVHGRRRAVNLRSAAQICTPCGGLQPVSSLLDALREPESRIEDKPSDILPSKPSSEVKSDWRSVILTAYPTLSMASSGGHDPDVAVLGGRTMKQDRLFSVYVRDPRDGSGKMPVLPASSSLSSRNSSASSHPPLASHWGQSQRRVRALPALMPNDVGSPASARVQRPGTSGLPLSGRGDEPLDTSELWKLLSA